MIIIIVVASAVGSTKEKKAEKQPTVPTVSSPTPSPTMSPEPTWSPTISFENLDNAKLEEAHPLVLRGDALENTGANFQLQEIQGSSAACDFRRNLATWIDQTDGLWYTYRARLSGPVTVTLCGSSYGLDLYSDGIHHVCSGKRNGDLGSCGGTSVSWIAQQGNSYKLLVRPGNGAPPGDETFTIDLVDNDECQYAYGPVVPSSAGVVMSYATVNAKIDQESSNSCGGASSDDSPGVWYLVEGTGRPLTASTCSSGTTFDTQIKIFGGSCGSLTCLNGNNDSCGQGSSITWPSTAGEIYYVLVQGANGAVGDFELTLSTDADRKENDFCATAQDLAITNGGGFTFSGSTADDVPVCAGQTGEQENLPHGLWYKYTGTGDAFGFTVSAPDEAPVVMNALTGSCGELACVEDLNFIGSAVVGRSIQGFCFPTVPGQEYFIFLATRDRANIDVLHSIAAGPGVCF